MGRRLSTFGMLGSFALSTSGRVKPTNHDHPAGANTVAFSVLTADTGAVAEQAGS